MAKFSNPLDNVKIAAPCRADWNEMTGSDRVRFCGECKLNVYNLSAMTRFEAESLLVNAESRLCVRFYRRKDGTILTKNCPVGFRAVKRRVERIATAALTAVLTFCAGIDLQRAFSFKNAEPNWEQDVPPVNVEPLNSLEVENANDNDVRAETGGVNPTIWMGMPVRLPVQIKEQQKPERKKTFRQARQRVLTEIK